MLAGDVQDRVGPDTPGRLAVVFVLAVALGASVSPAVAWATSCWGGDFELRLVRREVEAPDGILAVERERLPERPHLWISESECGRFEGMLHCLEGPR